MQSLCKVFPNLQRYISPILDAINTIQSNIGNFNLKVLDHTHTNLWQTSICVNAQTGEFHNENDCTYTIITTAQQECSNDPHECNFVLQLMQNLNVGIKLEPGITFSIL